MPDASAQIEPSMVALGLTVPTDERFFETIRDVTGRVAEYVGFQKPEARQMAEVVHETVVTLVRAASPGDIRNSISLSFRTVSDQFQVRIRFGTLAPGTAPVTSRLLEAGLRQNGAGGSALDSIRRIMDRVEFGEDEGVPCCRLIRSLPSDS